MTLIIAHRGFSAVAPENTLAAFEAALLAGANALELDVRMTRDERLVVIHDATVDRTTNGSGYVKDLTLAELRRLDAGSWFSRKYAGERVPLLNEVLRLVAGKNVVLNIELKTQEVDYHGIERKLLHVLQRWGLLSNTIISSLNYLTLKRIRTINPRAKVGMLWTLPEVSWVHARLLGAAAVHPHFLLVTRELVGQLHDSGLKVFPWTVDDPVIMARLVSWDVDGIITNRPDLLVRLLQQKRRRGKLKR